MSLSLDRTISGRLAGQGTLWLHLPPPSTAGTDTHYHSELFIRVGVRSHVRMFAQQALYPRSHLPSPYFFLFKKRFHESFKTLM